MNKFRVMYNNFDLIRLFAALQVVFIHGLHHLDIKHENWLLTDLTRLFPGVPIFFFISGFLISKSFENNPNIIEYAANRIFRIYPALIICTFLSLLSVFVTGYMSTTEVNPAEFIGWIMGQLTVFQFYNPEFMREFGTGVLNGSLWTITVELQFYIIIPVLFFAFRRLGISLNKALMVLIIGFAIFNQVFYFYKPQYGELLLHKLTHVSFAPWLYMFLIGTLVQRKFDVTYKYLAGKAYIIFPLYVVFAYLAVYHFGIDTGNKINPSLYIPLAALIFSLAYSWPSFSNTVLRRNDISYGVYIYHIPVLNILIYYGWTGGMLQLIVAISATLLLAAFSWVLIERPSLKLKRHPLNPLIKSS